MFIHSVTKIIAKTGLLLYISLFAINSQAEKRVLFDSHLHYGAQDVAALTPQQIMAIFKRNKIKYAVISSTPNSGTETLYKHAPDKIIPFLGLYQTLKDKRDWMHDMSVISLIEQALAKGFYRGLGELHIFAKDRKSPVLKRVVEITRDKGLILQVHGDAEILDEIFTIDPNATVLWAHMGTKPEPNYLRAVLEKHGSNLFIDTSVRDKQLLETGGLTPEWKQLFIDYQNNFMVAVDTFSVNRWLTFDLVVRDINNWLDDLPEGVAHKIAFANAYGLFFGKVSDGKILLNAIMKN